MATVLGRALAVWAIPALGVKEGVAEEEYGLFPWELLRSVTS
jgi:hypothetical protein